jgi:GNAT superfamily N-acetyltransferase
MTINAIDPASSDAMALMAELDQELIVRYPEQPPHGIDCLDFKRHGGYFVVAREHDDLLACGAFRPLDESCAEIKRMYVRASARRRGAARMILRHLEEEIRKRKYRSIVLETGRGQPEAIALYESEGYFPIPPYLYYVGNPISRCYAKRA